ncbi:MAG TPA: DEAD/DEAH box helicase [Aquihabitans sp.]|nr:DEAD/DEAH box helicase [Aquihabitans sp.]
MSDTLQAFEAAAWAAADGSATPEQLALLEAEPRRWLDAVEDLLEDVEDRLESVRQLPGPERTQVVADFEAELAQLEAAYDLLNKTDDPIAALAAADPAGEVRLQASWAHGQIVVWAAGPDTAPASAEELSDRLEAIGGPAVGWSVHPSVSLPGGVKAAALSIPIGEALGWLVAVGGGLGREGVGSSVAWLGRVAVAAVRLVARGAVVPTLPGAKRPEGKIMDLSVQWVPALVEEELIAQMAAAMPGPVTVLVHSDPRNVTLAITGAVVHTIVAQAAGMLDLAAPPPVVRSTANVAEAFVTRLAGSSFEAPIAAGAEVSKRIDRWAKPLTGTSRVKLVVQLDPPDSGDAWFLSVLGPGAEGTLLPIEQALADGKSTKPLADELNRIERIFPALLRPGALRRGQVYLSQEEAWELMTVTGPQLEAAGFDLRVPALSRRKPSPALRLFTEPTGDTVVGAHQLADVRWSVLFDDVELTAADIARLAAEARPLVRSHGRWVELDAVDLKEAAAALAERADKTRMTGAEILRASVGLEGNPLAGGVSVAGAGWATDLLAKAAEIPTDPVTRPEGFVGELRSYQAEAVAWLGFLHAVELGGCLALDMGLGKTPTMLAHLARTRESGKALVVAPPAVVGNWAREASRFVPGLKVVVHHGANRARDLPTAFARADVVITTYGTAVRDMDALSTITWDQVALDEAQAIKNHTSETAQQLRRLEARTRVALTGTPIENGLGDLWAILDFTNPGLVGGRTAFISQMQGEGEAALRALNGILVFRRTKSEPEVAAELPDRIDELDHCHMTPEQIGLYQAVLDGLVADSSEVGGGEPKQGAILAAITALKQICNHPAAYQSDDRPLEGRSGKLIRLEEIVDQVFASGEKVLIFTHFAEWGKRMADHLTRRTGVPIDCYHGGLARGARDRMVTDFQDRPGAGALVLSLKAGGTGLNLTAANHVVLYDRWWNPAVEDQARDRAWRIGQTKTVVSHRLVCPGTVDERVEEVVAGKRHIADLILPGSSSLADLDAEQLRTALGLRTDTLLTEDDD